MTTADAERTMQVLADSEASPEFIKALLAEAITEGVPTKKIKSEHPCIVLLAFIPCLKYEIRNCVAVSQGFSAFSL
ncbi:MAG: hypothetical protein V7K67_20125 [Nostoc sp.]|uniref:hypothetical protein n=1 Tax=Nostoc sp. TaxID=1180 RepID=UPI002FF7A866